jgi:hypothetical protein
MSGMNKCLDIEALNLYSQFEPVGLNEMDSVQLMNRIDTKFIFPVNKLSDIIKMADNNYRILEINNQRSFQYNTTYLDTATRSFFHHQMTGKLERQKVRYRDYESTGNSFLEVKRKTNKNRTIKNRIQNNHTDGFFDDEAMSFLAGQLPKEYLNLKPVLVNRFSRFTLVNFKTPERITFDFDMYFTGGNGRNVHLPFLAIAELKKEGYNGQSPFIKIMKKQGIHPVSFSKYCIGSAMLYNMPRKNLLKETFLRLNKIENECNNNI